MNCNYKVNIKDIQSKYTFKIFCAGGVDLSDYYTKTEADNKFATITYVDNIVGNLESILEALDIGEGV